MSPAPRHRLVSAELYRQVRSQLPDKLVAVQEISTPVVRAPDLAVLRSGAPAQMVLAVEILRAEPVHHDTGTNLIDYAEAGIPHYWLVDPRPPVTATIYCLYNGDYEESQRAEHTFAVDDPCPLTIDLDALLPAG